LRAGNTRRLRVTVSYEGTDFHGWQVQPGLPTIQSEIERVLAEIEGARVHVTGSGRTDAGVHALAQCAAFDLRNPIPAENLKKAMNRLLPPAIRILEAAEAAPDFHPRHHAVSKTYEYRFWRGEVCPPFERRYVLHHPYPLDVPAMKRAAPLLAGTHDFTAFASSDDKDERGDSKVRTIFASGFEEDGLRLVYRVSGSGFLKHMVRNLTGALLEIGKGNSGEARLRRYLEPPFTEKAGPSLPARGLFLIRVDYPESRLRPPQFPAPADRCEGGTPAEPRS
jgi:tRNA pseudouridine38-40 synthase